MFELFSALGSVGAGLLLLTFVLMLISIPIMATGALLSKYIKDGELIEGALTGFAAMLTAIFIALLPLAVLLLLVLMFAGASSGY